MAVYKLFITAYSIAYSSEDNIINAGCHKRIEGKKHSSQF